MNSNYQNVCNNDVEYFASIDGGSAGVHRTFIDINNSTAVDTLPLATPLTQDLGSDPDHAYPPAVGQTQAQFHRVPSSGEGFLFAPAYGIEFDFTLKRFCDPLPSLMAQYWTARGTIGKLQIEKQFLQLQLQSLQRHLSVHKLHVKFEQAKLGTDTYHKHLRLLEERRKAVIDSHFASVHGSHAEKYRMLLEEHLKLEDQFRQLAASHVVACYSLQKLIIDVVHLQNEAVLQTPAGATPERSEPPSTNFTDPIPPPFPGGSVCLNPQRPMPTVDPAFETGTTPTPTSSHFVDLMPRIFNVPPPPNLYYPHDELHLDRPTLTWATSYERTKLPEDDPLIKPQDLNGELVSFLVIVDRFIPEKDGRRVCTMCGEIMEAPSVVGLDDLQVLLGHLEHAHPRSWGKLSIGRV